MFEFFGSQDEEQQVDDAATEVETVVEEQKRRPMPDEVHRSCTDWGFLSFTVLAFAGVSWLIESSIRGANLDLLAEGWTYHQFLCSFHDEATYIYWCANSTGNGLDWANHHCVKSCPVSDLNILNASICTAPEQDYSSVPFGYFCMPLDVELQKQASESFTSKRGFTMRLTGVLVRQYELFTVASALSLFIGYMFVAGILLGDARGIVHFSLGIITYLPLCTGPYLLLTYFYPGGNLDMYNYIQISDEDEFGQKLRGGVLLTLIGVVMLLFTRSYKYTIDDSAKCLEASGDCLIQEWSILVAPIISLSLQVMVLGIGCYAFLCLAAKVKAREILETIKRSHFTDPQFIAWAPQDILQLMGIGVATWWLVQVILCASQSAIAFVTETWYFTQPQDGLRDRPWGCLMCKAYLKILTFHLGTVCLCGFLRVFASLPALVVRVMKVFGLVEKHGLLDRFYHRVHGDGPDFALIDLPLHSETFFEAGMRATQALKGELGHIHELKGALWMFHISGVGLCTAGSAYLLDLVIRLVPSFHDPSSNLFIFETSGVFIINATIGLVIGHNIMLGFDTVFDTIMYSYAIQLKRNREDAEFEEEGRALWWIPAESDSEPDPEENEFLSQRMRALYDEHLQKPRDS